MNLFCINDKSFAEILSLNSKDGKITLSLDLHDRHGMLDEIWISKTDDKLHYADQVPLFTFSLVNEEQGLNIEFKDCRIIQEVLGYGPNELRSLIGFVLVQELS
jgi:hypothetical protein